jgi:hypothetical protein
MHTVSLLHDCLLVGRAGLHDMRQDKGDLWK